jgi:hypothetical protein
MQRVRKPQTPFRREKRPCESPTSHPIASPLDHYQAHFTFKMKRSFLPFRAAVIFVGILAASAACASVND